MPDAYDAAVAYLTERPGEIRRAWTYPNRHPAGCLFGFVSPNRHFDCEGGPVCGCLTQIRAGDLPAWTEELTEAITADVRLPAVPHRIGPEHLPVFAEWNRRIDAELGRAAP